MDALRHFGMIAQKKLKEHKRYHLKHQLFQE
jgi:hypothetical protein